MYLGRSWDSDFWTRMGYDSLRVADYASTAYIRTNWAMLEPEEGQYAWRDSTTRLYRLLKAAQDKGMRLAFRIVVDGRDQGQNTPEYVFAAGAKGFTFKLGKRECITPYPDDPVFQQKYEVFLREFAKDFNDPYKTDFIDGYGLGKWGEAHSMKYTDPSSKIPVYEWITDLYAECFPSVPLLMNYHRVLAEETSNGWEDVPNPDSRKMLESAVAKGYSLRHDAFGMTGFYKEWEKEYARQNLFRRPIIMEGGWITAAHHRYWIDPCREYREGHPEDVRKGEYEECARAHVNMMDLRTGNETYSWFSTVDENGERYLDRFVREGGYRLHPTWVAYPKSVRAGKGFTVVHSWRNEGWAYCPTNIPQWNQCYKVAVALLDKDGKVCGKLATAMDSDLSKWVGDAEYTYRTELRPGRLPAGTYSLGLSLLDVRSGKPGLQMAVDESELTSGEWAVIGQITVE